MNTSLLLACGSLLSLAACVGSTASAIPDGDTTPSAADSAASTPPSTATPPSSAPPASTPTSSGPSLPSDPPVVKHCNVSSATGDVCFENAQGRAGEVVEVDVILVGDPTCNLSNEASSQLTFDLSKFVLQNVADVQDCRTRRIGPNQNNDDVVFWSFFGTHVVSGCVDQPLGKVDTIKLKIAPGTPPGDYDLKLEATNFTPAAGSDPKCGWYGGGAAAKIRVLP